MCGNPLPLEFFNKVGQTVAGGIDIRIVDLVRVAGQYDLGPFTNPGDNRLDFVVILSSKTVECVLELT